MESPQDFRRDVKGFSRNRERVSAESLKGIRGIVKGYLRIYFKGISAVRIVKGDCGIAGTITAESSYCIPT